MSARSDSHPSALVAEAEGEAWYHTIELPGGVVTRGYYDLRSVRAKTPLSSLEGLRCLDVGSANGYWAFEMEKAGAAHVVSLDLEDPKQEDVAWTHNRPREDWPVGVAGRAFDVARRHLGSAVERVDGSVYDLSADWVGEFDFVFIGNLLIHLRDPIGALEAIHRVCRGQLMSLEVVSLVLSRVLPNRPTFQMSSLDHGQWWIPSMAGHRQMVKAAGFSVCGSGGPIRAQFGEGFFDLIPLRRVRSLKQLGFVFGSQRLGVPSQWVLARPV